MKIKFTDNKRGGLFMKKNILFVILLITSLSILQAQNNSRLSSKSRIDWTNKSFVTQIFLDVNDSNMILPAGRNSADSLIKIKTPGMVKDAIFSLYVDNQYYFGDKVIDESVTVEQVTKIIENGKQSPLLYSSDGKSVSSTNTINVNNISRELIKHKYPYSPEMPIQSVTTRPYTGIVIDARGSLPVHGEYISSQAYPSFFPTIWDEDMNVIYEKNVVNKEVSQNNGIVQFAWEENFENLQDRIGMDPLYIKAIKVFGRNRTDPIIHTSEALKILSQKENRKLLQEGKVVILMDKENLIYDVALPEKNPEYYATFKAVKKYVYENKIPDIDISDSLTGILFSVDLKFIPDSPKLLPAESPRIRKIAEMLSEIIEKNEFTILVEGHTADLGKPVGQMNLSIERTRTVMNALIAEGIPESLFTYKGYGATRPVAPNNTEAGRAQNRRVDITARPKATYIKRDW